MIDYQSILQYTQECLDDHMELLKALAVIPAPSGQEELRAKFCENRLLENGAEGTYIDSALNVIWPIGVTENNPLVVFSAHSDVVFPDTAPLPLREDPARLYCPGIGDDTSCVAALLTAAKYIAAQGLQPKDWGILIVIDSGEEGLGNLKGTRQLFGDFQGRIREYISFDGQTGACVDTAVGSRRFRIAVETEGGHSYAAFGNRNAIAVLAAIIDALYAVDVPTRGKTTYNVGTVSGGTSVNSIAQHAEMLYEFRSDHRDDLITMQEHLDRIIASFREKGFCVEVTAVGERPCGNAPDEGKMEALRRKASDAALRCHGTGLRFRSGSTDSNIPLSLGIPAITVGCYEGAGSHTREEYVHKDSILPGLRFALYLMGQYF